jgi:hypothetical protein
MKRFAASCILLVAMAAPEIGKQGGRIIGLKFRV